jgi:hypothetical protein
MLKHRTSGNVFPLYERGDTVEQRIAKCIYHELYHGGSVEACANSIARDMRLGYIVVSREDS